MKSKQHQKGSLYEWKYYLYKSRADFRTGSLADNKTLNKSAVYTEKHVLHSRCHCALFWLYLTVLYLQKMMQDVCRTMSIKLGKMQQF